MELFADVMLRKDRIIQGWRLLSVFTTRINMKIACIYCLLFKNREDTERGTGDSRRLLHSSDGSQVQVGSERWRPGAESKLHLIWTRLPEWSLVPPRVYRKLESGAWAGKQGEHRHLTQSFTARPSSYPRCVSRKLPFQITGLLILYKRKGFLFFLLQRKKKRSLQGIYLAYQILHQHYCLHPM